MLLFLYSSFAKHRDYVIQTSSYGPGVSKMASRTLQMLIIILASLATISATDIFLPSLPSMAIYFGASEEAIQMTIPIYLLGALLGAPVLGSLSDYFGRRPVMLFGMAQFLFGTALCIYSPSLAFLLSGRFIQGFGAIVAPVVGWAIIQDLYPKDESAKILSWIGSIICIAPLVAPGLGGYIHITFGWQGNFLIIFLFAAMTMLLMLFSKPKLRALPKKEKVSPLQTFKIYTLIFKDKSFLFYISFFSLLTCGEWCYLTLIPFYFENSLHLSPDIFGLYLSGSASFYILGTSLTPFILNWLGTSKTLAIGIILSLAGSTLLLCVSLLAPASPLLIVIAVGLYFFGTSVIWGPSVSKALQRFEDIRGAASAVRSVLVTTSSALGGMVGSFLNDSSIVPLALFLLTMAIGCWVMFQKVQKLNSPIDAKNLKISA